MLATERKLSREITPAVERAVPGVEVLAVELLSPSRFCVYVDHTEGVDHALCARVTDVLSGYRESYTIDVSSPGLDRPLRRPEHFRAPSGTTSSFAPPARSPARTAFAARSSPPPTRSARIAVGEKELDIPYETIVRGNLIDEG